MRISTFCLLFIFCSSVLFIACKDDDDDSTADCTNSDTTSVTGGNTCDQNAGTSEYNETAGANTRTITANGIANHLVGPFPTNGNPTAISAQNLTYTMPANPSVAGSTTQLYNDDFQQGGQTSLGYIFGIMTTGVTLDPIAAEPFENTSTGADNWEWVLNALSTSNNLGTDCNNAHVQPNGTYHYHGTPQKAVENQSANAHSPLLGYAADGFPIYYKYVYTTANDANSGISAMTGSYGVKSGCRTGDGVSEPDGAYDGTYVQDYEYVAGSGTLDECNGRTGVTPEFPGGTYYYVITDDYPSVPRCFVGTPDDSFKI